jgi:hypothetical protein
MSALVGRPILLGWHSGVSHHLGVSGGHESPELR